MRNSEPSCSDGGAHSRLLEDVPFVNPGLSGWRSSRALQLNSGDVKFPGHSVRCWALSTRITRACCRLCTVALRRAGHTVRIAAFVRAASKPLFRNQISGWKTVRMAARKGRQRAKSPWSDRGAALFPRRSSAGIRAVKLLPWHAQPLPRPQTCSMRNAHRRLHGSDV